MSRIGRLPVNLDKGVKAQLAGDTLEVEGPKGKLALKVPPRFAVEIKDSQIQVKRPGDSQDERARHGLVRKLIANMAEGVSKGFTRVLEINGVGYRAEIRGTNIHLSLGYSHPIVYQLPPGVTAKVDRQVIITLESADRQLLGSVAAEIRELRPPEPYKGKGIKYATETIRRKAGKAAAGAAAG
ncbi:MAG TPA: 50S ribosomal protein L6 [Candidatus Binataceae bacterium]|jgi:large subunit ribosomal protein L6|nr:50S ribosomal protein L6 [Candidatus Binataceae bacterium]